MSLFSRLRAVVSGDDYLDGDYDDELDYDGGELPEPSYTSRSSALALSSDFSADDPFAGTNVIGMPGLSTAAAEVTLMEPRSFDEMPRAIQALRERKTVILNLTMIEEASSPTIVSRDSEPQQEAAPSPAWGRQDAAI